MPAPLIDSVYVLCDSRLPLFVHIKNLGEHVVGLELIHVDVKDVLALVWIEANDLVLDQGDLEEPLRNEVGGRVRGRADQNARYFLEIFHPVCYDGCDNESLSAAWRALDDR